METIIRGIVRHFVFVLITYISLYLVVLSFGGSLNFTSWDFTEKFYFALTAHLFAALMHGYWASMDDW